MGYWHTHLRDSRDNGKHQGLELNKQPHHLLKHRNLWFYPVLLSDRIPDEQLQNVQQPVRSVHACNDNAVVLLPRDILLAHNRVHRTNALLVQH